MSCEHFEKGLLMTEINDHIHQNNIELIPALMYYFEKPQ